MLSQLQLPQVFRFGWPLICMFIEPNSLALVVRARRKVTPLKHILINLAIMVFVAMVLLTYFDVDLRTGTAILSLLCGVGVLVVVALSPRMKRKGGVGNSD